MTNISSTNLLKTIKMFSLPLIFYILLITIRILGYQPAMEGELGDFITAVNFLIGAFISYFVFIIIVLGYETSSKRAAWWLSISLLMCLLAFDELFMIHEIIGAQFKIKDTFILLFYGGLLGILLILNLKETFKKDTFICLVIFAIMSIISQVSDYLYNEGIIVLMGREISYEQFLESFGALSLSCALVTFALREIMSPIEVTKSS